MGALLVLAFAVPLAMLASCLWPGPRAVMPRLLVLAPLPGLAAALLADGASFALPRSLLRLTLSLDTPGAILLGAAALLWAAGGWYAAVAMRDDPLRERFASWWLLTLAGSMGVFMAADLVSFYLVFAMVSLAAFGLIAHAGTPRARRAAVVTIGLALLGEAFLLMGFVLLAAGTPGGSLLIADTVAALPSSPFRGTAMLLLVLGFAMKIGTVPLHVWMPLSYGAAPIAAAAVLSGAAVKAGIIGFLRFLPLGVAMPEWGGAMVAAGFVAAFYGVAVGLTQPHPRTILAYSSVSQMGVLLAVLGMGLAAGDGGVAVAVAIYAAQHVLVKGGLFLAIGADAPGRRWAVLVPAAVVGLGLAGLPMSGGMVAKWVVKPALGDGLVGALSIGSAIGTALLMSHFLMRLWGMAPRAGGTPLLPWLVVAVAAVAVPWWVAGALGLAVPGEVLSGDGLWKAGWPVAVGVLAAVAMRLGQVRLPSVPPGDVIVLADGLPARVEAAGAALERGEAWLRRWPVAGVSLLLVALALGAAMLWAPRP